MTSKGRARSREYDYRPNLNTTQFSQGTLFSGGERTPPMHRGYTPARMQEVRQGFGNRIYGSKAAVAAATRNIARSTVPLSDIQQKARDGSGHQIHTGPQFFEPPHREKDTAIGYYNDYDGGRTHVLPNHSDDPTLIHELGHHKSASIGTEHSKKYSNDSAEGGQEEAFADDYASEHYRTPKGKPAPVGTYGGGELPGRTRQFWDGYHANRKTGPDVEKRKQEAFEMKHGSAVTEGLTPVIGQLPLLDKSEDGYKPRRRPPDWDYTVEQHNAGLRRG